jgi:hypothetical protein
MLKQNILIFGILIGALRGFDISDEIEKIIYEQKFLLEIVMISLVVILIYNYIYGCSKNREILKEFYKYNFELFKKNFYHVGLKLEALEEKNLSEFLDEKNEDVIEVDTPYFFRTYFTGRENVKYCISSVSTKRRQDFLVSFFYGLFYPERDRVCLEVALPSDWDLKGLIYIIRNKKIKEKVQDYEDLKNLCKKYNVKGLNNQNISVFAENDEILENVFDKNVKDKLNNLGSYIETLELSDCYQNELHKGNNIKMTFYLNKCNKIDFINASQLIEVFFYMIDRLAIYVPSKMIMEKLSENRKNLFTKINKDKIAEKEASLREEKLKKMTPLEKKKYQEKMEKKHKNKMSKKMMVVKKA